MADAGHRRSTYDFSQTGSPDHALASLADYHEQFTAFQNVLAFEKKALTRRAVEESAHKETNPRLASIYNRLQHVDRNDAALEKDAIIRNRPHGLHRTSGSLLFCDAGSAHGGGRIGRGSPYATQQYYREVSDHLDQDS